ncbi:MAG TPA: polysaccharide deacetylase family protein, partial [Terriglobales bacterium]|nr:polysaccharide deacetylase family protein [Terriglobales bacterium]
MKTLPQSALVISLDLELAWGGRDHLPIARYRKNLLGVRQAIPAILRLFQQHEIHATWAAVGLLFAETREELFASLPAHRPQYDHPRLSPYPDLEHLRANEAEEPCYFGASVLRQIAATPHQEIGSHSFSHFYCLEAGASLESFGDDLAAAQRAAAKRGMVLRSFVFPRNQYSAEH